MKRALMLIALLAMTACGGGGGDDSGDSPASTPTAIEAAGWTAGPTLPGYGNYSAGTVLADTPDGLVINVPQQGAGSTHYITKPMSLAGKHQIRLQGSVELEPGVQLFPLKDANGGACDRCSAPTIMALYFQIANPRWTGDKVDGDRWYLQVMSPIEAGPNFDITIPLDDRWGSVQTMTAKSDPAAFASAIARSASVGVVFGGGDGLGHGIYAVGGPARIVIKDLSAE